MKGYELGLYEKSMPHGLSLEEKLVEARKSGFDYLELSVDETDEKLGRLKWGKEKKLGVLKAMWETGVPIRSICLSGHRKFPIGSETEAIRARGMEIMSDAVDFAADIGVRLIQIAGYDEYYNPSTAESRAFFLENLGKSEELAARKGVVLAFETMETEFLNTVEKAMHYVDMIRSPWLQVYPDLGNITNAAILHGGDAMDDLKKGFGHIVAMHLKETVPGVFRERPYGTGHVDFVEGIRTAKKMGVRMFVGEFWCVDDDWKKQLVISNGFLRDKLDEVF